MTSHQRTIHPHYPPSILEKDYVNPDNQINNEDDDEGFSALLIDPVRAFGEVIDTMDNTDENDYDDVESQDEQILFANDIDDDEEEA